MPKALMFQTPGRDPAGAVFSPLAVKPNQQSAGRPNDSERIVTTQTDVWKSLAAAANVQPRRAGLSAARQTSSRPKASSASRSAWPTSLLAAQANAAMHALAATGLALLSQDLPGPSGAKLSLGQILFGARFVQSSGALEERSHDGLHCSAAVLSQDECARTTADRDDGEAQRVCSAVIWHEFDERASTVRHYPQGSDTLAGRLSNEGCGASALQGTRPQQASGSDHHPGVESPFHSAHRPPSQRAPSPRVRSYSTLPPTRAAPLADISSSSAASTLSCSAPQQL
ncbi:hypothetical protein BKA63DRAFT_54344 [Paraphoma chrysanthemicola]|nr:hypothetical protein BKA63DRAFT_54344 [Paraphoma chrysanthemicola]